MINNMAKKIFSIEGNIGAGKSSVLEIIQKQYTVYYEDISAWKFLDEFYQDKKRWAFTLQTSILKTMKKQYSEIMSLKDDVIFIERSPQSSLIFAQMLYQSNHMNDKEYELIVDLYNEFKWYPTETFFINTPVSICFKRMRQRDRECERNVDEDYLNRLNSLYMEKIGDTAIVIDYNEEDIWRKTEADDYNINFLDKSPQEIANEIMDHVKINYK